MKTNTNTQELTFSTENELETILLHDLCESITDLQNRDLVKDLRHLEFMVEQTIKQSPHTAKETMAVFALISRTFLNASKSGETAKCIYNLLHDPVKSL